MICEQYCSQSAILNPYSHGRPTCCFKQNVSVSGCVSLQQRSQLYLPDALVTVNHLLRDFRTGQVHPIEPRLLDLLSGLRGRLDTTEPFEVISGYRSPATNAGLRTEHSGVAAKSLHMQGMAIDIRLAGRTLDQLHRVALAQQAGGVGFYPQSDFVHVDVGRVRVW